MIHFRHPVRRLNSTCKQDIAEVCPIIVLPKRVDNWFVFSELGYRPGTFCMVTIQRSSIFRDNHPWTNVQTGLYLAPIRTAPDQGSETRITNTEARTKSHEHRATNYNTRTFKQLSLINTRHTYLVCTGVPKLVAEFALWFETFFLCIPFNS